MFLFSAESKRARQCVCTSDLAIYYTGREQGKMKPSDGKGKEKGIWVGERKGDLREWMKE